MSVTATSSSLNPYFQGPALDWDELLPNYLQLGVECSLNPNDMELRTDFEKQFGTLRNLRPKSFVPFYPIFLFHLNIMDDETLRRFLKEGKECDNHLTYVFCLHSLAKELQSPHSKERVIEIFKILKEFYPEDILLPAMIKTASLGASTFELLLPEASNNLETCICNLANKKIPAAILQLMRDSKATPGQPLFQPWLALAWALNGHPIVARIALERMATSLNQSFSSDYVQNILVSFINFRGEQDFVCPSLANPYTHQIESFIAMMESKSLDLKRAEEFFEASTIALGTIPESLIFLYFGLQHLLDNIDKYESKCESVYQIIYTLTKAAILYCGRSNNPHPWILENFKFTPTMDGPIFRIPTFEEVKRFTPLVPSFKFHQKFGISTESHYSLATAITNQGCRLMGKIFELSLAAKGPELTLPIPFPEKESLENYCRHALLADEPFAFFTAITYLRNYFQRPYNARPFELSEEFLNWARFSIFASTPPNTLYATLDADIRAVYYPEKFPFKMALTLAERDSLLAKLDLEQRTTEPPGTIRADADHYTLYLQSKNYFHWRPNETIEEWGERLKTQKYPPFPLFDIFHRFWTEFHQQIAPNDSSKKILPHQSIIEKWKKAPRPTPIGFVPRVSPVRCVNVSRAALARSLRINPTRQEMSNEKLEVTAATLLAKAETELVSEVSLKDQSQTLDLYRLVLEISVDRLIRRALSIERTDTWKSTLSLYLKQLQGSLIYHPEKGCYRIGVTTQCGIVRNANIYFKT